MQRLSLKALEIVWPGGAVLGECPVWDSRNGVLYWVDIKGLTVNCYDPSDRASFTWRVDEPVGCIDVPEDNGDLLAATRSGFAWLTLRADGQVVRRAITSPEIEQYPNNRFNDGKRAPDGSFWAGSMDDQEKEDTGSWWRLDPANGGLTRVDTGYRVTNGPAFDLERQRVFVTDSARRIVYVAPYSPSHNVDFSAKSVFLEFRGDEGYPDGMQVWDDGSLWIAFWDGSCVRRYSPEGNLVQEFELPVKRPTSLAFAPELQSVFVTSASVGLKSDGLQGGVTQLILADP